MILLLTEDGGDMEAMGTPVGCVAVGSEPAAVLGGSGFGLCGLLGVVFCGGAPG